MFSGEIPWSNVPGHEIIANKLKGRSVPISEALRSSLSPVCAEIVALINRCLDVAARRPSFAQITDRLRSLAGLPWILPPALHESLHWAKLDTLPKTAKMMAEAKDRDEAAAVGDVAVRVAELGMAMAAHKACVDTISARCGELLKQHTVTRIFLISNPRLRAAFIEKISLLKAQLEATFFQVHAFKEKERKQVCREVVVA